MHRRLLFAALLLPALSFVAARGIGPLPALGALLDPVAGVWGSARTVELPDSAMAAIPGLAAPVQVRYDDRGVPHIFAGSKADAWRAMGYVVARDRLFQLELQARAAAGTLTELVGPAALGADRRTRELGLPDAAERTFAALPRDSEMWRALQAYADGVNAYREALAPSAYPPEYRLLGTAPAPWEPIDAIHLFNRMGVMLASSETELHRTRAAALVGREAAEALFPHAVGLQEPIEPNGAGAPRDAIAPLPPPGAPDPEAAALVTARGPVATMTGWRETPPGDAVGSNNWAVMPRRTAAGHALLAGDPHLELTLPAIWYEVHLVVPGVLDVYGVTIPGAPMVVIGFTRDVAWTFTNTEADVMDLWREAVDDTASPRAYRVDGAWRPLRMVPAAYRGPAGDTLAVDTLRYTHRGPLRRIEGRWMSMRWTVLEAGQEIAAFLRVPHARTTAEWMAAMAAYRAPAQNMLVADRAGSIAIRSTGVFPVRPGGSGAVIHDGTSSRTDWSGAWAPDDYPQATDPAQGFLASANQQPVDPAHEPRYLGAGWYPPWRAMRINALLRADSSVTPDDMRAWQTDPASERVAHVLPLLLESVAASPDDTVRAVAARLRGWPGRYLPDDTVAVLFEAVLDTLPRLLWDELAPRDSLARRTASPGDLSLLAALRDPASPWWDRTETPAVERRADIVAAAFRAGLASAVAAHGPPDEGKWAWKRVLGAKILHPLRVPAWSRTGVPHRGGPSTLSPLSGQGNFSASWRMVVELGDTVRAWGIYPGGQSGHPASRRYDDRIARWSAGELDTLRVPGAPDALPDALTSSRLLLVPAGR